MPPKPPASPVVAHEDWPPVLRIQSMGMSVREEEDEGKGEEGGRMTGVMIEGRGTGRLKTKLGR